MLGKFKEKERRPVFWGLLGKEEPRMVGDVAGHIMYDFVNPSEEMCDLSSQSEMKQRRGMRK